MGQRNSEPTGIRELMKEKVGEYYIVVSRSRSTTCWVTAGVLAVVCATLSGQQPKRKPEPWLAAYLPAESAWTLTLPAEPAAAGAMDTERVYIPLKASVARDVPAAEQIPPAPPVVVALNRETGSSAWTAPIESRLPPVVDGAVVYVATASDILALDVTSGRELWSVTLERAPRGPMLRSGHLLIVLTEPAELVAIRTDAHAIAWRRSIGESIAARITADDRAVYAATTAGRLMRVLLADGTVHWDRPLYQGELGQPSVARDRVLVGTAGGSATAGSRSFFAVDVESGERDWGYDYRHLGGHPIGATEDDDVVYMAALDNILRAFNRSNGNQKWKRDIGTRPVFPPLVFGGTVIVTGINPMLSAFNTRNSGAAAGTWAAPPNTEPQGRPLIDPVLRPFRTAIVVILRDGQVTALRPTAMLFKDPAPASLTTLPGQPLQIERLPGR
jgi:outer membrane protein assembly factor BamB